MVFELICLYAMKVNNLIYKTKATTKANQNRVIKPTVSPLHVVKYE